LPALNARAEAGRLLAANDTVGRGWGTREGEDGVACLVPALDEGAHDDGFDEDLFDEFRQQR